MQAQKLEDLFSVVAVANGRKCSVNLVVSSTHVAPLLGRDIIHGLGLPMQSISLCPSGSASVPSADENPVHCLSQPASPAAPSAQPTVSNFQSTALPSC